MSMYVCIYIYIYRERERETYMMCVYVCMYVCMYVYIYIYIYSYSIMLCCYITIFLYHIRPRGAGGMIKFILMVNKQGQTRLAQYYDYLTVR